MSTIELGDVIYVERNCGLFGYQHFGVYSGGRQVVHYVKSGVDAFDGVIRETSLAQFLDGDRDCYICQFDDDGTRLDDNSAVLSTALAMKTASREPLIEILLSAKTIYDLICSEGAKLYSPQETVERARSCIGQRGYDLLTHNCEHFAIWCKTGVEKSEQVNEMLNIIVAGVVKL